ncbi:hypothetical protein CAAN1_09S05226 [[Candida] anglica]|uniref:C3H1-type domain-containing protein n=1 Tax=[Candida] anglica TaxID=148631 RepID=A0ABP0EF86_9ASCO
MPPKKKQQPSDKNKAKAKTKNADDKTFGLKNKNKSKKVQSQIDQIKAGADGGMAKMRAAAEKRKAEEKRAAEEAKREAAQLMGIQQQKVPFGVDPKSILCEFFRQGLCTKGTKCKFSHDLEVGRKVVKKDLYTDAREEKEADTMDTWDEEKLRKVIMSKHGNPKTTTDIVCKFFIEAVENGKYGWFWVCPNGGNECKYRHSLPAGFVLKTKEEKRLERMAQENAPKISLEEFIEMERGRLDRSKFTPITWATFSEWKKKMKAKREDERKKEEEKGGKRVLTGKEIILKKFGDKFYSEEDTEGDAWDLSQFKTDLPEETDETIKDYGDGSLAFSQEQQAPVSEETQEKKDGEEVVEKVVASASA